MFTLVDLIRSRSTASREGFIRKLFSFTTSQLFEFIFIHVGDENKVKQLCCNRKQRFFFSLFLNKKWNSIQLTYVNPRRPRNDRIKIDKLVNAKKKHLSSNAGLPHRTKIFPESCTDKVVNKNIFCFSNSIKLRLCFAPEWLISRSRSDLFSFAVRVFLRLAFHRFWLS